MAFQDALVTALSAVAWSIDLDCQTIVARQIDVLTLLGNVSKELSYRRKEALRPVMHTEAMGSYDRTTKPSTFLFGDDLPITMKEVPAISRIFRISLANHIVVGHIINVTLSEKVTKILFYCKGGARPSFPAGIR